MAGASGPRCAVLVGPYQSGKTALLEGLLYAAGAVSRKGTAKDGNTVGDGSPIARERHMTIEPAMAHCEFLGDRWALVDTPGSIEFAQDAKAALMIADVAVVVCEADPGKIAMLEPTLRMLDAHKIPHVVFINKIDTAGSRISEVMGALQGVSQRPMVLRQVPIVDGDDVSGYVDLISERAYQYKDGQPSALVQIPAEVEEEEKTARQGLLEALADFDDTLLEQLLEDMVPETGEVYEHLRSSLEANEVVPVMLGSGETQHGVFRLWKSLRHDTPGHEAARARRGFDGSDGFVAQIFKTVHAAHAGKLSYARVWSGGLKETDQISGSRVGGIFHMAGQTQTKVAQAEAGDVVALGRMDDLATGDVLNLQGKTQAGEAWPATAPAVYSAAIRAERREDEVKLSGAVQKLLEEDPSYRLEQNADTHEMVLWGQGEIHLAVARDNLAQRFNINVESSRPRVPYKETIRKPIEHHARHKKQSGGHGQFGDVKLEIKPLPRGQGFEFSERIVGGAVPRQFIPSVENGVREYLDKGPLGFPVVDLSVCLFDGQYHAVDSSDQAFRSAAALAMREAMPQCGPVLLEPICKVEIDVPSEYTSRVNTLITGRRGQILGFEGIEGWDGWDTVQAYMPQSEIFDLIIELRSLSQGVGTYRFDFDHMAELTGREADNVVAEQKDAA